MMFIPLRFGTVMAECDSLEGFFSWKMGNSTGKWKIEILSPFAPFIFRGMQVRI